uniref:Uncharacterized protein n=1 Tax=Arundo donax TaxID=35708 RepID=A0A0A8ZWR2_ARUDO
MRSSPPSSPLPPSPPPPTNPLTTPPPTNPLTILPPLTSSPHDAAATYLDPSRRRRGLPPTAMNQFPFSSPWRRTSSWRGGA